PREADPRSVLAARSAGFPERARPVGRADLRRCVPRAHCAPAPRPRADLTLAPGETNMTATVWTDSASPSRIADAALTMAARFWFVVAVAGQWIFAFYVAVLYGRSGVRGDFAAWNKVLPHGYVAGDFAGNLAVAMHLLLAALILICGPLQLIPQIRQ